MKKTKYDSRLVSATSNNRFLKVVILGLLFILVVLSLYIKQSEVKEKTIIVPTGFNQGFTIDGDDISAEYVIQMSRYLLSLKESFNPKNAAKQFDEFLGYLAPSIYGEFKQKNAVDLRRIKKSQISQVFHLSGVEVYGNNAYLFGDMTGYIGTKVVKEREAIFKIGLGFNGVLSVIEFTEVREELSQSGELRFIGVIASE